MTDHFDDKDDMVPDHSYAYSGPDDLDNPSYAAALMAYITDNAPPDVCPVCGEPLARDEEMRYCVTPGCSENAFEQEGGDDGNY